MRHLAGGDDGCCQPLMRCNANSILEILVATTSHHNGTTHWLERANLEWRTPMKKAIRLGVLASAALMALSLTGSGQAQNNMTFFITSAGSGKGADLGGLAGAGGKTWRAYLSTNAAAQGGAVNARDRIGNGPWQNAKGTVIAASVADLHSDNNKINRAN